MELNDELMYNFKYHSLFSEYLPTSFAITPLNNFDIYSIETRDAPDNVEPYYFSMSKFSTNDKRRLLYLPEVTTYIGLISFMIDNRIINELCEFSQQDTHSFSKITQVKNGVEYFIRHEGDYGGELVVEEIDVTEATLTEIESDDPSTYTNNIIDKLNRAKGAKGVLLLDIANCYKSIYTHYLTSIKIGLNTAKEQYKVSRSDRGLANPDYLKYAGLDNAVRLLNSNESHGILTGPIVSNYLVEAFLSRIDLDMQEEINSDSGIVYADFVRYVDDYEFFIYDEQDIDKIINLAERTFNKYRLTINDHKTQYYAFPYYVAKNLKRIYDKYTLDKTISTETIMEMFNDFFTLEKDGIKGAIRYLVKSIQPDITFQNKELYTTFLLNILVNDTRSLVRVCQLMIRDSNKLQISENHFYVITRLLTQYSEKRMEIECVWLIYLLKQLGYPLLGDTLVNTIVKSKNELAIIVLMHEYGLTDEQYTICTSDASSWILLYQLFLNNKISAEEFSEKSTIKRNLAFYKSLKRHNFSFYRAREPNSQNSPASLIDFGLLL